MSAKEVDDAVAKLSNVYNIDIDKMGKCDKLFILQLKQGGNFKYKW
ncbi:hypothetical protein [Candidatus Mesenet endosymbiont of Phosphuga atrata]